MYQIRNIILPITSKLDLNHLIAQKLKLSKSDIEHVEILRRSLDARQKNHLKLNFTVKAEILKKIKLNNDVQIYKEPEPYINSNFQISDPNPFIIGAGPAGLFAALSLVEKGFQPYIFDRGDCLEKRAEKVADYWKSGKLDPESNVQFGEGGAGTFSDGKLTSRKSDYYTNQVTNYLIEFGAPEEISYEAHPHLGTDGIRKIVLNIRKFLEANGCKFFWNYKLENISIKNNKVESVIINNESYQPEALILALGNATRDTFELLSRKIEMESKPFAVGFRIEHPQEFINETFFGKRNDFSITGPASYRLTAKTKNRGIYSFCMCPGGQVIGSASEPDSIVTNGMSNSERNGKFGNSAIVVTVNENDYGKEILAGMHFQRNLEQTCFKPELPYFAPAQNAADFMNSTPSSNKMKTSYLPDTYIHDLNSIFPTGINSALKSGMKKFETLAKGFIEKGIFLAPETRTSSPVRIIRDKVTLNSLTASNLFPCGEGAGFAGGIMSSAADGFKVGSQFYR
ncbi:MAG: hypothetical protein K9N09_10340 [Candidatus Cloacimonetes bacterium]|nr:hypothetical protein [Candidatus Cloacimonadota bacterium]MCF7814576.1 hypothetical protein [Candidatus Cloacimonadota bacterium]MCF7869090.1 hypothetical protein [Candidatus Cloacimonadota bacterium]MCF7884507.1 hypothetical protein [Candidatus Cloacimonadota bacterium]